MYLKFIGPDGQCELYEISGPVHYEKLTEITERTLKTTQQRGDIYTTHYVVTRVHFDGRSGDGTSTAEDGVVIICGDPNETMGANIPFAFITNWNTYLLNKQGQTIDRLNMSFVVLP